MYRCDVQTFRTSYLAHIESTRVGSYQLQLGYFSHPSETHVFSANLLGLVIVIATSMSNDQQAGPYLSNLGSPGEENASKEAKDDPLENASCLHKPIEGQQGENENLQTDKIISV